MDQVIEGIRASVGKDTVILSLLNGISSEEIIGRKLGFEASREIRSLNSGKARTIPIIAMTANVFREDVEKCLEAGMNDHIGKPLDFDKVLEKLRVFLPS